LVNFSILPSCFLCPFPFLFFPPLYSKLTQLTQVLANSRLDINASLHPPSPLSLLFSTILIEFVGLAGAHRKTRSICSRPQCNTGLPYAISFSIIPSLSWTSLSRSDTSTCCLLSLRTTLLLYLKRKKEKRKKEKEKKKKRKKKKEKRKQKKRRKKKERKKKRSQIRKRKGNQSNNSQEQLNSYFRCIEALIKCMNW
jgi:hypothetical protein